MWQVVMSWLLICSREEPGLDVFLVRVHNLTQRATLVLWVLKYKSEMFENLRREIRIQIEL